MPTTPSRYFAYGSTLDAAHVSAWAAEHGYPGFRLDEGRPAVLDDYELALEVPSRYWSGAVGTLRPRPGALVYGVLFELAGDDLDKIRHKEGVTTGLYRELVVEVRLWVPGDADATLQLCDAVAFAAAEGRAAPGTPPSARWLDAVVRGAAAHGLPESWLAELQGRAR